MIEPPQTVPEETTFCEPHWERQRTRVPAARTVDGTPMCADCFSGVPADKDEIGELIRTLEAAPKADEAEKNPRAASWRRFWDSINLSVALHTRIFLYEQWRGKARHAQSVEVSGKNGAPLPVQHTIRFGDGDSDK